MSSTSRCVVLAGGSHLLAMAWLLCGSNAHAGPRPCTSLCVMRVVRAVAVLGSGVLEPPSCACGASR